MQDNLIIEIGNTDNKLTQQEWSRFVNQVEFAVRQTSQQIYGIFLTEPSQPYQSAAFHGVFSETGGKQLTQYLLDIASEFRQDEIAVCEVAHVHMLHPSGGI